MANVKVFENVNKGVIQQFEKELGANCTLGQDGVTWTIKDHGIIAEAVFDEGKSELTVTVVSKPWIIPVEVIWMKLQDSIKQAETTPVASQNVSDEEKGETS